jgi:hypothetical protein
MKDAEWRTAARQGRRQQRLPRNRSHESQDPHGKEVEVIEAAAAGNAEARRAGQGYCGTGTWTKGSASAAHLQGLHSLGEALAAEGMARGRRRK